MTVSPSPTIACMSVYFVSCLNTFTNVYLLLIFVIALKYLVLADLVLWVWTTPMQAKAALWLINSEQFIYGFVVLWTELRSVCSCRGNLHMRQFNQQGLSKLRMIKLNTLRLLRIWFTFVEYVNFLDEKLVTRQRRVAVWVGNEILETVDDLMARAQNRVAAPY